MKQTALKTAWKNLLTLSIVFCVTASTPLYADDEEDFDEITPQEVLAFVKNEFPQVHKELVEIRAEDEEEYEEMLEEAAEVYIEYQDIKGFDAAAAKAFLEMHRTEFEAFSMMDQGNVDEAALRALVKKHVEARFVYEEAALKLAEQQIKEERENLTKEKANIEALIDELVKELKEVDDEEDEEDDGE